MRLSEPRIPAVQDGAFTGDQRAALGAIADERPLLNLYRTLAHAPKALARFLPWGAYVLSRRNSLPARQREIVILRTGFLCKSGYEFAQHAEIGRAAGLTDAEIAAIKAGMAAGWSDADAALIRACDELHADQFVTDRTWADLRRHFDRKQCMDVVFTVGQYTQVSMMLNSFGVQLEAGQTLDPDLKGY
jgi:alkylhydroperoxidase family enzyme